MPCKFSIKNNHILVNMLRKYNIVNRKAFIILNFLYLYIRDRKLRELNCQNVLTSGTFKAQISDTFFPGPKTN